MGQGGKVVDLQPDVLKHHSDEGYGENPRCRVQLTARWAFSR